MTSYNFKHILICLCAVILALPVSADVKLPKLISDGMVLQHDTELKIWGWADPDEEIEMGFKGKIYQTTASADGNWSIILPEMEAGGPYEMSIKGNNSIIVQNILIGDVWLCSGQSNMELPMYRVSPLYEKEIAEADNDQIRYFEVPKTYDFNTPFVDLSSGKWESVNSKTIHKFSAVAYFFATELNQENKIPIGLINSSLGGSPAEAWLSEAALKQFPHYWQEAQLFKNEQYVDSVITSDQNRIKNWYSDISAKDIGTKENLKTFETDDSEWEIMEIPGYWNTTSLGDTHGVVWFRKSFELDKKDVGHKASLLLGRIVDADSVFVNGIFVGNTTYQYPPRRYTIPKGILRDGKNTIAIKIINERGNGGFVKEKDYELVLPDKTINLKGLWKFKLGTPAPLLKGQTFVRWKPLGLFNAMIHPLLNYRIKGTIWYQGESNTKNPEEYDTLFPAVISDWRQQWQQGDFPFLFVQLTNFMKAQEEPTESGWARTREAQTKALSLPNTGMATTIDIGEWNDIHPLNKKDVGHRLALAAQKIAYGKDIVASGPMYKLMEVVGNKIVLEFSHTGGGLVTKDGASPKEFAIAGADGKYVWAKAKIVGNKIEVWSDKVPEPKSVRYAWANNPDKVNLYNEEGLPAVPFRTDH
ncbi:beta galactosidase jelly roll domain-containing protein [Galbibacter sp. EGI 63066]|uniref:sialate O-acetylesterase n=1 Tax=Galbibacter sp. EGI 63066 TaxID=2993559 RepID=UPI0022489093|nr:sialate O-acetylesterase [Galbibacter sp. EGI 63066]MCX2680239.1 beta galactosidase jelly roll domain-containing protein [Galbibacter sp. EGI 63066]